MGEAKRRKKILGEDYGKVPPILVVGSKLYEKHLEQFYSALENKVKEINPVEEESLEEPSEEEINNLEATDLIDHEQMKTTTREIREWLATYFAPYQAKDREKLIVGIMHPLYEEMAEPKRGIKPDLVIESSITLALEAVNYYSWFKGYLSEEVDAFYAQPLTSFYDIVLKEGIEENSEEPMAKLLQSIFSEALDLQESS